MTRQGAKLGTSCPTCFGSPQESAWSSLLPSGWLSDGAGIVLIHGKGSHPERELVGHGHNSPRHQGSKLQVVTLKDKIVHFFLNMSSETPKSPCTQYPTLILDPFLGSGQITVVAAGWNSPILVTVAIGPLLSHLPLTSTPGSSRAPKHPPQFNEIQLSNPPWPLWKSQPCSPS